MLAVGSGFHVAVVVLVLMFALLADLGALGLVAGHGAVPEQAWTVFACTLATVLLRTILSAYRGVVAGAQRIDLLGRIGAAASLFEGMGAGLALACGWGLRGMALNSFLAAAGASCAEALAAHRLVPGLRIVPFRGGREEWRDLLGFGLKLQVVRASEILAAHAPRLSLAAGAGLASAGAYDLGARVAGALQLAALPLPVIQPLAGRFAARGDRQRLGDLVERATRFVALLALPCAALVLLDAGAILKGWTGQSVPAASAATARWLALALCCGFIFSPLRLVLRGSGLPGPEAIAALGGALLQLLLAVAAAPLLGAAGVAASALAAAVLSAALVGAGARRVAPGLGRRVLRPLGAAIVTSLTGLCAAGLVRLLVSGWTLSIETRGAALARLLPEGAALACACLPIALLIGILTRDDLATIASTVLPGRFRVAAGGPLQGPRGGA